MCGQRVAMLMYESYILCYERCDIENVFCCVGKLGHIALNAYGMQNIDYMLTCIMDKTMVNVD